MHLFDTLPTALQNFMKNNTNPLKDLDLIRLQKINIFKLNISEDDRLNILETITKDVEFLSLNNLMDYSLLIGIEVVKPKQKNNDSIFILPHLQDETNSFVSEDLKAEDERKNVGIVYSLCGKFIYHILIIDYLQAFGYFKKVEFYAKRIFTSAKGTELSSIDPKNYGERFIKFMKTVVFNT